MKKTIISIYYLSVILLTSNILADGCTEVASSASADPSPIRPLIIPRNQGANTAREIVGIQDFIHHCSVDKTYGVIAAALEYTRSFRPQRIAEQLFGHSQPMGAGIITHNDDDNFFLFFQGSSVEERSDTSLLADNFGLSQDFDGSLTIRPKIENYILDLEYYIGLDCWIPHLWFRSNLPITRTRWNLFDLAGTDCARLGSEQETPTSQNTPFPSCYMASGDGADQPNVPATSIITALSGNFLFGDMKTPWKFGKFSGSSLDLIRLADIDLMLGYDFMCEEDHHFGLFFQVSCPTGNSPDAEFIFEPISGNGDHWGMGAGISTHYRLWEDGQDQQLSIWMIGNAQHLFRDQQTRSFDFKKQGPLSRYMLIKEFDQEGQYTGNMINAINFATRRVDTKMRIMGDASIKLAYDNCGFTADIGYNVWGRSEEQIRLCLNAASDRSVDQRENTFGIKGCQGVCFIEAETNTVGNNVTLTGTTIQAEMLSSTQSNATPFECTSATNFISSADNPQTLDTLNGNNGVAANTDPVHLAWDSVQTNGSIVGEGVPSEGIIFAANSNPPVLLSVKDLNIIGVPSSLTHKIFGYAGYTWFDNDFTPFFGVYGEIEFDNRKKCKENRYHNRSINQWGIAMKMGITY